MNISFFEKSRYFYEDELNRDEDAMKKHLRPVVLEPLLALYERLNTLSVWNADTVQACVNDTAASFDMNMSKIAQPLRVAITGSSMSPAIDVTLTMIGKARVLSRLTIALDYIRIRAAGASS